MHLRRASWADDDRGIHVLDAYDCDPLTAMPVDLEPAVVMWQLHRHRRVGLPCKDHTSTGDHKQVVHLCAEPGGFGQAALFRCSPGAGTATPSSAYWFSLLRSVRIEMPRILA